jgi:CHAD domain-containing protein
MDDPLCNRERFRQNTEMQIATETERKYDVPAGFALPDLPGAAQAETFELDATYFDTDDLRLARNRRTLRRRSGGADAGWHLKTPGAGSSRTEHRLPLDGEAVPEELQTEVRAIVRGRSLRPVARLRTRRSETPVRDADGRTLAVIAHDQVRAETGGTERVWEELEVELVDGGPEDLDNVERRLLDAGATPADGPSKLARALGDRLPAPNGTSGINPVFGYARAQRDAIVEYDPGARRADPESVHKMRVATRRLRSTLKTFKRSFPPELASRLGPELRWLAHQLGEVRDGQVLSEKLVGAVHGEGPDFAAVAQRLRDHLDAKVTNGREALADDLNGDRYLALLDDIDELVADPDTVEEDALRQARKVLRKADRLLEQALADGSDAELHEARKAYKQARYAVEVFEDEGGKRAKELIKALTDLQDVLGAHQDSVVAREILSDLAGSARDSFPYGVLYAHQEQVGRNTFGDLPVVIQAAGKSKLRAWLD